MFNSAFKAIVLTTLFTALCAACSKQPNTINENRDDKIIIGWQTLWSPAGQIAQTLIHTDIAKNEHLDLNLIGFLFGPDMNEAAMNHNINCLNTGNVPTTSLLAKSDDWVIVARLIRQSLAIVARTGSGISKIEDLRGKTIGLPYGSGPHPYLLCLLKRRGLWHGKDDTSVKLMNVAPSEQVMALQQKAVDAIATWEPQTAIAVLKKLGTVIDQEAGPGFIIVEKKFAVAHPRLITQLLKAYLKAEYFVGTHRELTDDWFSKAAHFNKELISKTKIVEPNILQHNPTKVNLDISDEDLRIAQQHADIMFETGLIRQPVSIKNRIDSSYLRQAQSDWQRISNKLPTINILTP